MATKTATKTATRKTSASRKAATKSAFKFAFPKCKGSLQAFPEADEQLYCIVLPEPLYDNKGNPLPYDLVTVSVRNTDPILGHIVVNDKESDIRCYLRDLFPKTAAGKKAAGVEVARRMKLDVDNDNVHRFTESKLALLVCSSKEATIENFAELSTAQQAHCVKLMGHNEFSFFSGSKSRTKRADMLAEAAKTFRTKQKKEAMALRRDNKKIHDDVLKKWKSEDKLPTQTDYLACLFGHEPSLKRVEGREYITPMDQWAAEAKEYRAEQKAADRKAKEEARAAKKAEREAAKAKTGSNKKSSKKRKPLPDNKRTATKKSTKKSVKSDAPALNDYVKFGAKRFKIQSIDGGKATINKDGREMHLDVKKLAHQTNYKSGRKAWALSA